MKLKKIGYVLGIMCICTLAACEKAESGDTLVTPGATKSVMSDVTNEAEMSAEPVEKNVTKAPVATKTPVVKEKETEYTNVTEVVTGEAWELGNLQGNLLNEGWVCENDGMVYYRDCNHDNFLCKMNPDGSGKQILAEEVPRAIQVVGDWVYFIDDEADGAQRGRMKRVSKNGGEVTVIGEDKAGYMLVTEKEIIYTSYDIKKMNLDGSECCVVQKFTGQLEYAWLSIFGDCVFTADIFSGKKLYAVKKDGSGQYILDEGALYPTVNGDALWYAGKKGALTKLSLTTGEKKVWDGTYAMRSVQYKDKVYYHDLDDIYAIGEANQEPVKLYPKDSARRHFIELFWVAADRIYFCDYMTDKDITTTFLYMDLTTGEVGIVP
ncbi:MAG: DUF5050 domain-containing protein [Lachnospiraceae bacterium]|nr:DUF5050 domain-containing protein [Lachnospiraceae bacterium]